MEGYRFYASQSHDGFRPYAVSSPSAVPLPPPRHDAMSREGLSGAQGVIPGLGLGFSASINETRHETPETTQLPVADAQSSELKLDGNARVSRVDDDTSSGEVRESDFEDLYEPSETLAPLPSTGHRARLPAATHVFPAQQQEEEDVIMEAESDSSDVYEASQPEAANVPASPASSNGSEDMAVDESPLEPTPPLTSAKERAREAISGLWPMNVQFDDYLNEGIDSSVLEELFAEAGLKIPARKPSLPPTPLAAPVLHVPSPRPQITQAENIPPSKLSPAVVPKTPTGNTSAAVKDKAEERKDRIARLLAAKGSKAAVPSNDAETTIASSNPVSKKSAEKSRLIQQKMEALRKAREERERAKAQVLAVGGQTIPESKSDVENAKPLNASNGSAPVSSSASLSANASDSGLVSESVGKLAPQIGSQAAHTTLPSKRPVASDFIEGSERPHKRAFVSAQGTKPFLIDVSDDEENEDDMDIDLPARQSPASDEAVASPRRTGSFRERPALPDQRAKRVAQTASPASNAQTQPPNSEGQLDLESMNKQIEAMKRMIAEAEARKKTKQPHEVSPSPSHQSQSEDRSEAEPVAAAEAPVGASQQLMSDGSTSTLSEQQLVQQLAAQAISTADNPQSPTIKTSRRSVSRSASNRLPLLEAHRREQLRRLQALQVEVAGIEKQLADDMEEETRLRAETVTDSDSGEDLDEESSRDLPETVVEASKQAESESSEADNGSEEGSAMSSEVATTFSNESRELESTAIAIESLQEMAEPVLAQEDQVQDAAPPAECTSAEDNNDASSNSEPQDQELASESDLPQHSEGQRTPDMAVPDPTPGTEHPEELTNQTSTQQISNGHEVTETEEDIDPEVSAVLSDSKIEDAVSGNGESAELGEFGTHFVPYETPLQYFRAFRFHPQFEDLVKGGLRSLTFSNKIDVKKPLCTDQLAGRECPRGSQCQFQHFESIQAPDDQILLQLGGYETSDETQRQEYINGLRQLLTDFRTQEVKDFKTISQGIIEYRAKFQGDKSRILPLGDVTL